MKVIAYYASWDGYGRDVQVSDMDGSLLTHVNLAFANLEKDGSIVVGDPWIDCEKPMDGDEGWETCGFRGHFYQLKKLRERFPHLKVLVSVGGWSWSGEFSQVADDAAKRARFAESAIEFLVKYQLDGLDIDWEFPVEGGNEIAHLPQDKENYTLLLKETREAFERQTKKDQKHYLLSIAGGPNPSYARNTELAAMAEYLDYINVMTYDYHGTWDGLTGHNAPLYGGAHGFGADDTIRAYLEAGVPAEMLNLGLAFYGRGWSGVNTSCDGGLYQPGRAPEGTGHGKGTWEAGGFEFHDLYENYMQDFVRGFDEEAKVPFLYKDDMWISYDDEESIGYKVDYARAKGLGGVMFWEFAGDKNKVLQKLIDRKIKEA